MLARPSTSDILDRKTEQRLPRRADVRCIAATVDDERLEASVRTLAAASDCARDEGAPPGRFTAPGPFCHSRDCRLRVGGQRRRSKLANRLADNGAANI